MGLNFGRLLLGIAGAVLGSFFGMPALGWAIGSALGGVLFPTTGPTIEGPRLQDLNIMSSAYGKVIPIVYGSARVGSNIIWAKPIQEVVVEKSAGGGGKK